MPIYEYHCDECGNAFEALVRQGVAPACPECASPKLSKQWSTFAAKGDGASVVPAVNHGAGCGCGGSGGNSGGGCGLN